MLQLLFWRVGLQDFALPVSAVSQVVRAVALTAVRGAPAFVCGSVNIHGRTMPVVDIRQRFGLPGRALALADHFIVVDTPRQQLALWVDVVLGVMECMAEAPERGTPADSPAGVVKLPGGAMLMHDLEQCLAADDRWTFDEARP